MGKPQVVCSHTLPGQPQWSEHAVVVVPDCREARTVPFWTARLPAGVSFTLTFWPAGWGYGQDITICRHQAGELEELPPVAGDEPASVAVLLPNGAVRQAMLTPLRPGGRPAYRLHERLGDARDSEAWEAVIPRSPPLTLPTGVVREVSMRRRARCQQAAKTGTED